MLERMKGKNFERWLGGYLQHLVLNARARPFRGLRHLLFTVCDHYEPLFQNPTSRRARARVQKWVEDYPRLAAPFRDADGRPPQHTFFLSLIHI